MKINCVTRITYVDRMVIDTSLLTIYGPQDGNVLIVSPKTRKKKRRLVDCVCYAKHTMTYARLLFVFATDLQRDVDVSSCEESQGG